MVVIETKFDRKTYVDYYKFDMITQDFKFRLAMIITLACIIAAGVFECINEDIFRNTALTVGAVMIVLWVMQFFFKLNTNLKTSGLNRASVAIKYEVSAKKIVWNNRTTGQFGSNKWSDIIKARNNGKYIYLYITKTHALVINTEHIVSGIAEELKKIIAGNVEKYK